MMSMVRTIDRHLYGVFQKFPHMESALRAAFAKDLWIAAVLIAVLYGLQLLGYISLLVSAMLDENSTLGAIIRVPSQIIGTPVELSLIHI